VRTAAAIARERLVSTAAARWNVPASDLTTKKGVVSHKSGKTATYGSLAKAAAATRTAVATAPELKSTSDFRVLGTSHNRIDAMDIVTGRKQFAMDTQVPNAKPCMVRRPPTING